MRTFPKLEEDRAAAAITQKDLCAAADIDESTYWRWKAGVQQPNTQTLGRADKALDALTNNTAAAE